MKTLLLLKFVFLFIFSSCSYATNGENGNSLDEHIKSKANVMVNASDLDALIEKASVKKLVLLGEASHGTHEYYAWRDSISRRLISEKDFNFIVVEGDFASLFELNRYVKDLPGAAGSAREVLLKLDRWPMWMWGNHEVLNLIEWLREYNSSLPADKKVGFYGMDVYDEWRSKEVLINFLKDKAPQLHEKVRDNYDCFTPYTGDSWAYARDVQEGRADCSDNTVNVVKLIEENKASLKNISNYDYFYAVQNAYVVKNAERFYRKSAQGLRSPSWNARATHMFKTAKRLRNFYGENSKGIVWAHNTHIGDASYTDMSTVQQVNIGELSRDHFGADNVLLVGFTTYKGKVQAGSQWGQPRQEMNVIRAQENSIEEILNRTGYKSFYLIFDDEDRNLEEFMKPIGNRAIGVVYNPQQDFRQYVSTIVPMRYDALIFFNETKALKPIID